MSIPAIFVSDIIHKLPSTSKPIPQVISHSYRYCNILHTAFPNQSKPNDELHKRHLTQRTTTIYIASSIRSTFARVTVVGPFIHSFIHFYIVSPTSYIDKSPPHRNLSSLLCVLRRRFVPHSGCYGVCCPYIYIFVLTHISTPKSISNINVYIYRTQLTR